MKEFPSLRMAAAAGLCSAALFCAACNNNEPTTPAPPPPPSPVVSPVAPATTPAAATAAVTDEAVKAAQAKLDEVTQYIKDNKLDAADKALTDLEQNKASLPPAVQEQLPSVRSALNAAKTAAGSGVKLPGT